MIETPFLTIAEVAARWRLEPRSVRDEVNRKRLPAAKIGGQWLIDPEDVDRYEKSHRNVTQTEKRTRAPRKRAA